MHIISKAMLGFFWESCPAYADAEAPMVEWFRHMEKSDYPTPQALKEELRTPSILKGGRVVFNIGGNKYRVVLQIDYARQWARIRFVGTQGQYDQINAEVV